MLQGRGVWHSAQLFSLETHNHGIVIYWCIPSFASESCSISGNSFDFHFLNNWPSREEGLVERANSLKVNAGSEPGTDLGPVISKQVNKLTWTIILNIHDKIETFFLQLFVLHIYFACKPFALNMISLCTGKGSNLQTDPNWRWKWCQTCAWWEKCCGILLFCSE